MSAKSTSTSTKNTPVTDFRLGNVKAAVWANKTDEGKTFYNVTFIRSYRDDKGNWHDADSYGRDDLPRIAKLADLAYTFIFAQLAKKKDDTDE